VRWTTFGGVTGTAMVIFFAAHTAFATGVAVAAATVAAVVAVGAVPPPPPQAVSTMDSPRPIAANARISQLPPY
jgi:hypothetical protein